MEMTTVKKTETVEVQLLSIRAVSSIVLSQGGKVINPYQQVWNTRKSAAGSVMPVAFDSSRPEPAQLVVNIAATESLEGYTLEGLAGGTHLLFSGKMDGSPTVTVQSHDIAGEFLKLQNNTLYWQLTSATGDAVSLGTTYIEMYWVNIKHLTPSLYRKGTPVETLQRLSSYIPLTSQLPGDEITALLKDKETASTIAASSIVQNIFNYNPPRYDVWLGAPHFVTINGFNNITLHYNAYLAAHGIANSILNCYDAAAVLQYNFSYYGYATKYCFMQPFGYLKLTNLIGRGICNNPFFASSGGAPVIAQTNPARTAFGNHAFTFLTSNGAIADACAGPHIGNEYPQTYVNNATDGIFPNPPRVQRGKITNIGYYTGVTHLGFVPSMHMLPELPHSAAFSEKIGFSQSAMAAHASQAVAGKWPEPAASSVLHHKWTVHYEEVVPGNEEVLKMWMLKNGEQMIMIKLYVVSTNNSLAANRFLSIGSLSQSSEPVYESGPAGLGHYSAISRQKGLNRIFWVYHNAVLDITSTDPGADIEGLSHWYHQWATRNLTGNLAAQLPSADVHHSSLRPKVGERLYVSLITEENTVIDFHQEEEGLQMIANEDKTLVFDAIKPSRQDLQILVIDKETLLVSSVSLKLEVSR